MEKSNIVSIKSTQRFVGHSKVCISHMTQLKAILVGCEFTQPSNLPNESQVTLSLNINFQENEKWKYEKTIHLKLFYDSKIRALNIFSEF